VVDNFLPGVMERFGFNVASSLERIPRLIWCTITGFGQGVSRPGYDFVVQAEQGWMSITGEANGIPLKTGVALADVVAGKDAAIAILAALTARGLSRVAKSAEERRIHISLAHSATAALVNVAQNALMSGINPPRFGNAHPNLVPYQLFSTGNGAIILAVGNDDQWRRALIALGGLDDLLEDERLRTNSGRVGNRERVTRRLAERLAVGSSEEWMALLGGAGVPCGVVRTVLEALGDVNCSAEWGVAPSVPGSLRFPAPLLGEHTEEILRAGWSAFR